MEKAFLVLFVWLLLQPTARPGLGADISGDLANLYWAGLYDEVIAQATKDLKDSEQPDRRVQYLRGHAAYQISWFGMAERDLAPLGDFVPWEKWPPASQLLQKLAHLRSLCPPNVHEISLRKTVLFRVYYEADDAWTRAVVATLPAAYEAVCSLYGAALPETAVFVFSTGRAYDAFCRALDGPPTDWEWASGASGRMTFCPYDPTGRQPAQPGTPFFKSTVAHEFSHCLLGRYLGPAPRPTWFEEGAAMLCGALLSPGDHASNDSEMARVLAGGRPLPLEVIDPKEEFYGCAHPNDAYTQAFSMVRFLYLRVGRNGTLQLVKNLKAQGNLDKALTKSFRLSTQQFYDLWLQAVVGG
jgi:hypothetical protein